MGTLIAKVKSLQGWMKIQDQIDIPVLNHVDLSDSMVYDPNNNVAHQWFKLEHLQQTQYYNELFRNPIDAGELTTLNVNQLDDIKFFAYYANNRFYIQRMLLG